MSFLELIAAVVTAGVVNAAADRLFNRRRRPAGPPAMVERVEVVGDTFPPTTDEVKRYVAGVPEWMWAAAQHN